MNDCINMKKVNAILDTIVITLAKLWPQWITCFQTCTVLLVDFDSTIDLANEEKASEESDSSCEIENDIYSNSI